MRLNYSVDPKSQSPLGHSATEDGWETVMEREMISHNLSEFSPRKLWREILAAGSTALCGEDQGLSRRFSVRASM